MVPGEGLRLELTDAVEARTGGIVDAVQAALQRADDVLIEIDDRVADLDALGEHRNTLEMIVLMEGEAEGCLTLEGLIEEGVTVDVIKGAANSWVNLDRRVVVTLVPEGQ